MVWEEFNVVCAMKSCLCLQYRVKSLGTILLAFWSFSLIGQDILIFSLDSIFQSEILNSNKDVTYSTRVRDAARNWIYRDTSVALYINRRGLDSCLSTADLACILKLRNERGILYSMSGDYKASRKELYQALELGNSYMDSSIIGYVHRNIGVAYRIEAQLDSGFYHFYAALNYLDFRKSTDSLLIAITLEDLAKCLYYSKLYKYSLKYVDEALQIAEALDRKPLISSLLNLKGINALDGNLTLAKEVLDKSFRINKELKDTQSIIINLHNNALYYIESGIEVEKGLDTVNLALELMSTFKGRDLKSQFLITKARALFKLGKIDDAEKVLTQEINTDEFTNYNFNPGDFYNKLMADIKRAKGEYGEAFDYLEKYYSMEISKSIFQNDMLFNIKERDIEFSKRTKENQLLRESKLIIAESLEEQKRYLRILWTFATALVLGAFYLVHINLKLSKSRKKIKVINDDLLEKNNQLVGLINTKDSLLSIIGHDLRSPAVNILQMIQAILDRKENLTDDTQDNLTMSANSVGLMIQILDNLLAWVKTDKNTVIVDNRLFSLQEVVSPVVKLYESMFKFKRLRFENQMEWQDKCYSDKGIIEIVIRNLLNNAIKYSPPDSTLIMISRAKGHLCEFFIEDEAGGLPANIENKIFHEKREKNSHDNIGLSEGFGLKLCRDLLEISGIQWHYQKTEKGSRFTLYFPLGKTP